MRRVLSRRIMPDTPPVEKKDYLCVTAPSDSLYSFQVKLFTRTLSTMEYIAFSKDGINWEKHTSDATVSLVPGEKLYIKGSGTAMGNPNNIRDRGWYFNMGRSDAGMKLSGNIMSLLYGDEDFEKKTTVGDYAFAAVFNNSSCYIDDISELRFPATTVGNYAYCAMFGMYWQSSMDFTGCHLSTAPKLPATTLGKYCYSRMFWGTGLTEMPDLPATTLAEGCYEHMFSGCRFTDVKILPATTLANNCYQYMFDNCFSITNLPHNMLPATTLAAYCYSYMFSRCSGLNSISSDLLPATNLASHCYEHMFDTCIRLSYIPDRLLPATTLAAYCYANMFESCRAITRVPRNLLPATTLVSNCYNQMFYSSGVAKIPATLLPASTHIDERSGKEVTNLASSCYNGMFSGCKNLTTIPEDLLPATILAESCYIAMFQNTGIEEVPATLLKAKSFIQYCCSAMFAECSNLKAAPYIIADDLTAGSYAFKSMFRNCTKLTHMTPIPGESYARIPFTSAGQETFMEMFMGCKAMTEIPIIDVEYLGGQGIFNSMYKGCSSLESIPEHMFAKTLKKKSGIPNASNFAMSMFEGCTSLDSTKIPSDLISTQTIIEDGYQTMFKDCTSLETPIALPSVRNSYNYMYQGCTSLKSIATMDANVPGVYRYMYQGCTGLITVNNLPNLTSVNGKIRDYTGFFKGCTSLTSVPTIQGTDVWCSEMFSGCTSLTSIAVNLTFSESDTAVAGSCYQMFYDAHTGGAVHSNLTRVTGSITIGAIAGAVSGKGQFEEMFKNCITLEELPTFTVTATAANYRCYRGMFERCSKLENVVTSLTSNFVSAPIECYEYMYRYCALIEEVPAGTLPAGVGASGSYVRMFYGCTQLNTVYCMLSRYDANVTFNWLGGVAATGTFYKRAGVEWQRGENGIPNGWTVVEVNA